VCLHFCVCAVCACGAFYTFLRAFLLVLLLVLDQAEGEPIGVKWPVHSALRQERNLRL
jgi:hypothetical protein